ncbi:MAG TPA: CdvA-like protein [Candidatus Bathyarchaeia archaeon]|nr:CdvA-like protein [Candidatus Bathyarchaeia archaeon]
MKDVTTGEILSYIGKALKNEYGRTKGRLAGPIITPLGHLEAVLLEHEDGEFTRHLADQLKFEDGELKIISTPKVDSESLYLEVSFAWRRVQALEDLLKREAITQETYNELHNEYVSALDNLKERVTKTIDDLETRIKSCGSQIRDIKESLTDLDIAFATGEIKEEEASKGIEILKRGLSNITFEKAELESLTREIRIYLTSPPEKLTEGTTGDTGEKPLTVRIKNVDADYSVREQGKA